MSNIDPNALRVGVFIIKGISIFGIVMETKLNWDFKLSTIMKSTIDFELRPNIKVTFNLFFP